MKQITQRFPVPDPRSRGPETLHQKSSNRGADILHQFLRLQKKIKKIDRSIYLFNYLSIYLSIHQSIFLSAQLSSTHPVAHPCRANSFPVTQMASRDQMATKPITGHQKTMRNPPIHPRPNQSSLVNQSGPMDAMVNNQITNIHLLVTDTLVQILSHDPTKRHDKIEMQPSIYFAIHPSFYSSIHPSIHPLLSKKRLIGNAQVLLRGLQIELRSLRRDALIQKLRGQRGPSQCTSEDMKGGKTERQSIKLIR